ncbi:MAG: dienelactone hydrolase family protein, partial [Magnetospirillum sp.]|nr:dienelactone hydrolase family protein [Magnetospirillum sp.]
MDCDLASLLNRPSRRAFMGTALAATGFALAAGPVAAETITTDGTGLDAGPVLIPGRDRDLPAYAARPQGGKPVPVVLVVQEIFGVHEHIRDVCRRLAK